jgi:pyruvate-formate lyase-activating enzyme
MSEEAVLEVGQADAMAFGETFKRIEQAWRPYRTVVRRAQAGPDDETPASFCARLLEELEPVLGGRDEAIWGRFVAWAGEQPAVPGLFWLLAAEVAAAHDDWTGALELATAALSADQYDLRAQDLFRDARARVEDERAVVSEDLAEYFCGRPFEDFELTTSGQAYSCCPVWLPVPIGDYRTESAEAIWNSPAAQELRRSILDGDYRYCSKIYCPFILERSLPRRSEVKNPLHREVLEKRLTVLPWRPQRVRLSHDRSCNLTCPSCRKAPIVARKDEVDRLNALFETTIAPLLRDAVDVTLTGSGDPFGSAHFRYVLKRINRAEFPRLKLRLQTNGVLLDRKAWEELELEGLVSSALVSIDAATPETYAVVRRGGSFERLLENLAFLGELRRAKRIGYFRLDFVVQALNFREMPAMVELARAFGCDVAHFQMIRNWGTFSLDEYRRQFIGAPDHPDYPAFLEVLRHPNLALPMVDLSTVRRLHEYALSQLPAAA